MFSHEIGQEIAISEKSGKVYCKDQTVYLPSELKILNEAGGITKGIHLVKKIFGGSVVAAGPIKREKPCKEASKHISEPEKHSSEESTPKPTEASGERFLDWQESVIF